MNKIFIGQFETRGNLYVIDPLCKLKNSELFKLTVKPGTYNVYVMRSIVSSLREHTSNDYFATRNFALIIEHVKNKEEIKYRKSKKKIAVNTGTASFLNKEAYFKHHFSQVPLLGLAYRVLMDEVGYVLPRLDKNKIFLENHPNLETELENIVKKSIAEDEETIKMCLEQIESKKFKEVINSCDYEEIIENLADGEFNSMAMNPYGAVARSGLGDGLYDLFVAKNSLKQIVACKIKFIEYEK